MESASRHPREWTLRRLVLGVCAIATLGGCIDRYERPATVPESAALLILNGRGFWVDCRYDQPADLDRCRFYARGGERILTAQGSDDVYVRHKGGPALTEKELIIDPLKSQIGGEISLANGEILVPRPASERPTGIAPGDSLRLSPHKRVGPNTR